MRRKAKALKPDDVNQEMPNRLLSDILTKLLITEGAEVLQKQYNFTQEQSAAWAIETMSRVKVRMSSEERTKANGV